MKTVEIKVYVTNIYCSNTPVPFIQLKDEVPDKWNRPTRLLDGAYFRFPQNQRVAIVSGETSIDCILLLLF